MKKDLLLVQIDSDSLMGQEILPSQCDIRFLGPNDNTIYQVLETNEYGQYTKFKDIVSGDHYESALASSRFRVITNTGPIPEQTDIAPKVKEDETIII